MSTATIIRKLPDGRYELQISKRKRVRCHLFRCKECQDVKPENYFTDNSGVCFTCQMPTRLPVRPVPSEKWLQLLREESIERAKARNNRRAVALASATPTWVSRPAISAIYAECRQITARTGIVHHVDHIWPLQHAEFCGLHVPWNLRVIPAFDNCSKNNKRPLDEENPNCYKSAST